MSKDSDLADDPLIVSRAPADTRPVMAILAAMSVSHCLNDTIQSLFPALYPLLEQSFALSYTQIGLITLVFQGTASLFQPLIGLQADRRPKPFSLAAGMGFSLFGLLCLALAPSYAVLLLAAALVGMGSAVFHPEARRPPAARIGEFASARHCTEAPSEAEASTRPRAAM